MIAQTVATVRLACKHKMDQYTGKDVEDVQKFLLESVQKIFKIVKDTIISRISEFVESVLDSDGTIVDGPFQQVFQEIQDLEQMALSKESQRCMHTFFKHFQRDEKESGRPSKGAQKIVFIVLQSGKSDCGNDILKSLIDSASLNGLGSKGRQIVSVSLDALMREAS